MAASFYRVECAYAGDTSFSKILETNMSNIANPGQIRLERRSPSYRRVTFDYPPLNIFGSETKPVMFCDLVGSTALSTPRICVS
jgi:hypothetical protein